jgi:hypothetical protein
VHRGYIKLHRIFTDWEWYTEPNMVLFLIHCLLRANHKDGTWKGQTVLKGQFISGRKTLSNETGLSEQKVRTCIDKLISSGELTIKPTNKNSLFTLIKWEKYQLSDEKEKQATSKATNKQPTDNQQITTNKNVKNANNEKNNITARELAFKESLFPFIQEHSKDTMKAFYDYWSEPNKSKSKMKWEVEKTWDLERRVTRWANNNFNSSKSTTQGSIHVNQSNSMTVEERSAIDALKVKQLEAQGVLK